MATTKQMILCSIETVILLLLIFLRKSYGFAITEPKVSCRNNKDPKDRGQKYELPQGSTRRVSRKKRRQIDSNRGTLMNPDSISRLNFLSISTAALLTAVAQPSSAEGLSSSSSHSTEQMVAQSGARSTSLIANEQKKKGRETFEESVSGFAAGAAVSASKTLVKYPLDTATVRLQMPNTEYSIFRLGQLFDGSFRGVTAPLLSNIPAGSVFFAVKDASKAALGGTGVSNWLATSLAVAAAQFPYWLVRNPSEVIKTRQQAGVKGYGEGVSIVDAFRLASEESKAAGRGTKGTAVDGLYVGYWENVFYAYPADVIKFVCYDSLTNGRSNLSPQEGAVAGAAATAIAQFLTTPFDVIRNRVMAGEDESMLEQTTTSRRLYLNSLANLSRQEGIRGLFAGTSPRVGKAILSGAIQFATYEETKQRISNFFGRK